MNKRLSTCSIRARALIREIWSKETVCKDNMKTDIAEIEWLWTGLLCEISVF